MRFSVRDALGGMVIFALAFLSIMLLFSNAHLRSKLASYGLAVDDDGEDRVEIRSVGSSGFRASFFRVENYEAYSVEVDFILGATLGVSANRQVVPLEVSQYVITFDEGQQEFWIEQVPSSLGGHDRRVSVPFGGKPVSVVPRSTRRQISGEPFFVILFGESRRVDKAFFNAESRDDFVGYCQANKHDAVTFTLRKQ